MVKKKAAPALKAGLWTIILAGFLAVIKALAFVLSGSLAVLSSFLDSFLDLIVSTLNFAAIHYSAKPADEEHRYGHGKIEGLAALLQSILIFGAAVFLVLEAFARLVETTPMDHHLLAVAVMVISICIAMLIVYIQRTALERSGSLAVEADQAHYSSDIFIHGGVIVAVLIQYFNGPVWVDAGFAILVALWLANLAREILGKGLDMVLDRELPETDRQRVLALINKHEGVLGVHDLRTTRSGMKEIITFDIEADPQLSLHDAHAITKDLEAEILEIFPEAEIMIHVDPHGEIEDSRHTVARIHH